MKHIVSDRPPGRDAKWLELWVHSANPTMLCHTPVDYWDPLIVSIHSQIGRWFGEVVAKAADTDAVKYGRVRSHRLVRL